MDETQKRPPTSGPLRRYPNDKIADPAKLRLGDCCWPVGGGERPPDLNGDDTERRFGDEARFPRP